MREGLSSSTWRRCGSQLAVALSIRAKMRVRLGVLALQAQDAGELRQQLHRRLRIVGHAHGFRNLQGDAGELLGLVVAALVDQDAGKPADETRRDRIVLAGVLQARQQCPARVDLGFGKPALPRLHPRLIEHGAVRRPAAGWFRRADLSSLEDRPCCRRACVPPRCDRRFRLRRYWPRASKIMARTISISPSQLWPNFG